MDIADACDTMKDMDELSKLNGFDEGDDSTTKVCGLNVPSIEEIKNQINDI